MYTEGIKVGDNSYILSDEDGTLTLLNGKGTPEEMEEYINLKNAWEEEIDNYGSIQDDLYEINNKDRLSKTANIEIILSLILIEGLFIAVGAVSNLELIGSIQLFSFPLIASVMTYGAKTLIYGTKKKRTRQKEEIKKELGAKNERVKEIEKKINKLKEKIESETLFWEDEIVPVTTEENKKANVKMRVLKLDQSR